MNDSYKLIPNRFVTARSNDNRDAINVIDAKNRLITATCFSDTIAERVAEALEAYAKAHPEKF